MLDRPPCVGFGTYLVEDPEAIRNAIKLGYRHFDCAYRYGNERMIGEVFKEIFNDDSYGVKREDLWIVSKLWPNFHEPEKVAYQIAETLRDLQLEYLDVFLMHWPLAVRHLADRDYASSDGKGGTLLGTTPIRKTWEAMEACVDKKQTRFIGVSNMGTAMLIDLLSYCRIKPFTNQFESQPYFPNDRLIEFCNSNGIYVTAYRPLGGRCRDDARAPLTDPALEELAKKANLTVSELILAWHWTRWGTNGTYSVIPKSNNQERQRQNLESVKLRLTPDQMDAFARLGVNLYMGAGASSISKEQDASPCAGTAAAISRRLEGVPVKKSVGNCERGRLAKALMGAHLLTPDSVEIFEGPPPIRGVYETTALIQAVKENDEALFDKYLTQLSFRTNSGRTALMYASELGRQQMVERLLDEVEVIDLSGRTALIYALEAGHYDIANMLIPYEVGKAGVTDFMFYAQTGDLDALLAEQDNIRMQDLSGHTALMFAVVRRNVKAAELLLEEMALKTTKGVTALMLATQRGYGELVYLLATSLPTIEQPTGKLNKRTGQPRVRSVELRELNSQTRDMGNSALMLAAKNGDILAAYCLTEELYLQDCDGKTALMYAAERGDAEMVKFLCSLMKKGDRVQVDKKGRTALMYAAAQNHKAVAEHLLLREQRFQDVSGRTALSYALEHTATDTISLLSPANVEGHFSKITQLMIDAACGKISEPLTPGQLVEVHQQDISGRTALMYAALSGHTEAVEQLCIEVEDLAHGHESVLQMCIKAQRLTCLQILLLHVYEENVKISIPKLSLSAVDYETDLLVAAEKNDPFGARTHINQAGKLCNGWTALMTAAYRGHIDIVKLLLCEVKLQNEKGWTALMFAVQTAQLEVVQVLARYELGLKDNEGETALVKAIRWNAIDMVKALLRERHVLMDNRQTALSVAMEMGNEECLKLLKAPKL